MEIGLVGRLRVGQHRIHMRIDDGDPCPLSKHNHLSDRCGGVIVYDAGLRGGRGVA